MEYASYRRCQLTCLALFVAHESKTQCLSGLNRNSERTWLRQIEGRFMLRRSEGGLLVRLGPIRGRSKRKHTHTVLPRRIKQGQLIGYVRQVVFRCAPIRLRFKHHQSLISLINSRHKELLKTRSTVRKPRRHIVSWSRKIRRGSATSQVSILHVEDSKQVAQLVADTLAPDGFDIDSCVSGTTALKILTSGTPLRRDNC